MDILHQLGDLVLGSVPTMVLFVLLIVAYGLLVRRPLDHILAERRNRTSGAIEQARGAIAAAEAETSVYEDRLRSARAQVFAMREHKLAEWAAERERTLGEVRVLAGERVQAAKTDIGASVAAAQAQIEVRGGDLVHRVLAAILPSQANGQEAAQ